jgi:hypothetical protein
MNGTGGGSASQPRRHRCPSNGPRSSRFQIVILPIAVLRANEGDEPRPLDARVLVVDDAHELRARVRSLRAYTDELDSAEAVIMSLVPVEARDVTTEGHCQRLSKLASVPGFCARFYRRQKTAPTTVVWDR